MSRVAVLISGLLLAIVFVGLLLYMNRTGPSEASLEPEGRDVLTEAAATSAVSQSPTTAPTTLPALAETQPMASGAEEAPPVVEPVRSSVVEPPSLKNVVAHWTLLGLTSESAFFRDENIPQEFTLTIGGTGRTVRYPGWSFNVSLEKADPKGNTAYVRSNKHKDALAIRMSAER